MKDMRLKLTLTGDGRQLSGVLKDAQNETRQFGTEAQSAGGRAETAFGKTRAGVESISTQLESARQQVLAFVGVSQLIGKAADLTRTAAAWQDAETRLSELAGSAAAYAEHEAYLIELADDHHKNLLTLSDSYSRLLTLENAGLMTNEQNRQILEGLSNATSRLGADNAQLEQTMYGLAQGLSAGILRAEEFNQVTEPLPGLMQELDKAAGLGAGGFRKLVNAGEVTSAMFRDTLIEALKAYDGAAADTANNINAKLTDVENSYINLARVLEQPITDALSPVLDGISGSMALVAEHGDLLATGIQVGMVVAAGRGVSALTSLTTATLSDLAAKRAAAVQELELAKAQAASTAAALRNAQAQVGLTTAHGSAAKAAAAHQAALVRLTAAKTAVRGAGSLLLGVFGGPVGLIATVGLAAASFIDFGSGANSAAKEAKALEQQTKLLTTRIDELTAAQARQRLQLMEEPYKQAQIEARGYAAQVETLTKRLSEFPGSAKAEEWRRSLIDAQGNLDTANATLAEYTNLQGRLETQVERLSAAQNEQTGQVTVSSQAYISLKSTLDDVTRINQQYYELVQKITSADITSAEKQELLSAAAKKRSADLEQLNKKQQTAIKLTDQQVDKYAELVEQLKFERDQLQRTELQRMIEINLRQVGAEVTAAQHDEIVRLTTALYNEEQATQAVQDELKLASNQTNVWADITENAVNSVDNSFRELFHSGLDGWDDFWDQMLDTAKDMLAELAYTLIKQQLWVNVGMSVTGQGGGTGGILEGQGAGGGYSGLLSNAQSLYSMYSSAGGAYPAIAGGFQSGGISGALQSGASYVGGLFGGSGATASMYAGASQSGYTGAAFSNWVAAQGGTTGVAGGGGGAAAGSGWMGAAGMAAAVIALPFIAQALDSYFGGDKTPEISLANMSSAIRDMYEEDVRLEAEGWRSYQNYAAGMGEADVENYHTSDFRYNPRTNAGNILQATYLGRESPFSETSVETPFGMLGVGRAAYMGETNLEGVQQFLNAVKNIDEDLARYLSVQQIESISESLADWVYDGGGEGSTVAAEIGRQLRERLGIQLDVIDQELAAFVNDAGEGISQQNLERFSAESQVATLALAMEGTLDVVAIGINQFKALSLEGENTAQTITRTLTQTMAVMDVLDAIELNFSGLGDEMLVTADRLVKLSGGIDALTSSANYYYQNYFTEQERAQIQVDSYTAMLSQFNAEFDTALSGRDDLRAFVESLDLTSESGQSAYVAAMQLAPALVELERALAVVNEPARQLAARGQELQSSINDVVWGFMSAGEQLSAYQRQITQFNGTLGLSGSSAINSGQSLSRYLESLDLSTESGQSAAESALAMANAIKAVEAAERAAAQARQEAARASAQAARNAAKAERDLAEQRLKTARSQLVSAFQSELSSLTQQQSALESAAADAKLGLIAALRNEISSIAQQEGELQQQIENAKAAYAEAIDREISAQQAARDEAESTAKAWRTVVDQLSDARSALLDETLTPAQQQFNAQAAFNDALSQAWAGSMEAFQSLPTLAQSAQAAMLGNSATGEEYRLATAQLVAQLDSAGALASTNATAQDRLVEAADQQLSALQTVEEDLLSIAEAQQALAEAEQELSAFQHQSQMAALSDELDALDDVNRNLASLDAARAEYEAAALAVANSTFEAEMGVLQEQLDWLQRLNGAVLSLPEALAAYLAAGGEALPKFADGGIATGPTSGYRVELHGTEAVIPLKHGSVPVSINASGMGDELRALRTAIALLNDDMRKIGGQQIKSAQRLESLIRKWDIDGQPEVRRA